MQLPIVMKPDAKLQTKYFVTMWIFAVIGVVGLFIFLWLIFASEEFDDAGTLALLISAGVNILWLVPTWILIPFYYRSLQYEIDDDEVIVRVGVITKSVKHVPYRTVTNLTVVRGPLDRIFGMGALNIQTAGMSGQQGVEESLTGLVNYEDVYNTVAKMLRRYRGAMTPDQAGIEAEAVEAALPSPQLDAILQELRGIRQELSK